MRRSRQILLTIMITMTLLALAWYAGSGRTKEKQAGILIAICHIPAGSRIQASQLGVLQIPAQAMADCFLEEPDAAVGLWTSTDIQPGEPLIRQRLAKPAAGLAYPDPGPGRRLLTISLDPADANGFWLAAGNRVDLFLIPRNREKISEVQVLENIRIMEVLTGETSESGVVKASSGSGQLLCLDLNIDQARLISSAPGIYEIRLAVINDPAVG